MQEDPGQIVDALGEVLKPPFQIVQQALDREWLFPFNHEPSEVGSDDEPPINLEVNPETITIDGTLGLYDPEILRITIFRKGINHAAEILHCRVPDLELVVRVHEWSHALLHVGLAEREHLRIIADESLWRGCLSEATAWFKALDVELHERLAQLLTHHGLRSLQADATLPLAKAPLERIACTFQHLTQRAPAKYQISEYTSVPKHRLVGSIGLLKNSTLIGAAAWETVVTW